MHKAAAVSHSEPERHRAGPALAPILRTRSRTATPGAPACTTRGSWDGHFRNGLTAEASTCRVQVVRRGSSGPQSKTRASSPVGRLLGLREAAVCGAPISDGGARFRSAGRSRSRGPAAQTLARPAWQWRQQTWLDGLKPVELTGLDPASVDASSSGRRQRSTTATAWNARRGHARRRGCFIGEAAVRATRATRRNATALGQEGRRWRSGRRRSDWCKAATGLVRPSCLLAVAEARSQHTR